MASIGQVHWHEGLFLRPHHLQAMQRYLLRRAEAERRLGWAYPYGVVEARLSPDAVEAMKIRFERLHVLMPDGVEVDLGDADLDDLSIEKAFASGAAAFTVYLAVPRWSAGRPNASEGGAGGNGTDRRLYRVVEADLADENTGDNPQKVALRRVRARLMLEDEDATDLDRLPVLRIARGVGNQEGLPREDPFFVPPCLVVQGSPVLRKLLRDLGNQVEASRRELAVQLTRGGFDMNTLRGPQIEQVLRLRVLNRYAARLPKLAEARGVTPFDLFLELTELLGELAALHPDRDEELVRDWRYEHDNPAPAFFDLDRLIRPLLSGQVAPAFRAKKFAADGSFLTARLDPQDFTEPSDYYVGIKSKQGIDGLSKLITAGVNFKFVPRSQAAMLTRGLELIEDRHAPLGLPAQADLYYFRIDRGKSGPRWQVVQQDKAISAVIKQAPVSDYEITLYMLIPSGN